MEQTCYSKVCIIHISVYLKCFPILRWNSTLHFIETSHCPYLLFRCTCSLSVCRPEEAWHQIMSDIFPFSSLSLPSYLSHFFYLSEQKGKLIEIPQLKKKNYTEGCHTINNCLLTWVSFSNTMPDIIVLGDGPHT